MGAVGQTLGSLGFSRKSRIELGSWGCTSITPNWSASEIGCRIAATVHAAPESMCWSTIWEKSMR